MNRRVLGVVQLFFGGMLLLGSGFEVANLLFPELLPSLQDNPVMSLHHSNRIVYWWTLLSNGTNLGFAGLVAQGGVEVLRRSLRAWGLTRIGLFGVLVVAGGGVIVSGWYLVVPMLLSLREAKGDAAAVALVFSISIIASWVGIFAAAGFLAWGHRKLEA